MLFGIKAGISAGTPSTFSARASCPMALKSIFFIRLPTPAELADAATDETAVDAAEAIPAIVGWMFKTWTGTV